jgi:hypothetical protein
VALHWHVDVGVEALIEAENVELEKPSCGATPAAKLLVPLVVVQLDTCQA